MKLIIYKIQENGRATDFQFAQKCPEGFMSIEGDRIPEDITPYHEPRYIKSEAVRLQRSECGRLLKETDCKVSEHTKYPADVTKWKTYREELWTIQDSEELCEMPSKPF